tara:strand:+ start:114 stop:389 length:276 start_codon:yes stop_codon:yes gene_type:complete
MAELATQEVKLFGKWSFDDVEVRFYFGNVVGGVVISQTRTTAKWGDAKVVFLFFPPFFAELSLSRALSMEREASRRAKCAWRTRIARRRHF